MRISVSCSTCEKKFFLKNECATKRDLAHQVGEHFSITCPHCESSHHQHINDTYAEATTRTVLVGTTLWCGALGLLAGPVGGGIGVLVGAYAGYNLGSMEGKKARTYNNSFV